MLHKKYQSLFRLTAELCRNETWGVAALGLSGTRLLRTHHKESRGQRLDPFGRGVGFRTFLEYMTQVLVDYDKDMAAQEMIVEQFIASLPALNHTKSQRHIEKATFASLGVHEAEANLARALLSSGAWCDSNRTSV